MRSIVRLLGLLAGLAPWVAAAQLAVTPAAPRMLDAVRLQIPEIGNFLYDLGGAKVAMADNTITVSLRFGGAVSPMPPPHRVQLYLGQFPVGTYQVNVVRDDPGGAVPIGSVAFTVTPKTGPPFADFTDLWWSPAESGWGLNIVQHPSGSLFLTWFVYDGGGHPVWFVVPGGTWTRDRTFDGTAYRTSGPVVGDTFDPAAVRAAPAGHVTLQFDALSAGRASFLFQGDGQMIVRDVVRQPY